MKMNLCIVKLLIFLKVVVCFSSSISTDHYDVEESIFKMIADVISTLFLPSTAVSLLMCTKIENVVALLRILSKKHILSNRLDFENFNNFDHFPLHKSTIFLDLNCPQSLATLKKANDTGLFSAPLRWLILQNEATAKDCKYDCWLEHFKNFAIYPDSEIIVIKKNSVDEARILSFYKPSPFRPMKVEDRGFWKEKTGIWLRNIHASSRRRRNLELTPLKSSIVVTNPDTLNHLTDHQSKNVDGITKINFVWLNHIVSSMNATVNVSAVDNWGYQDKNGSWTGMVGNLSRKEIDIGGTSMFLVADRLNIVHYIPLSTKTRIAFIFRQPPLSLVSNLFTLPFGRSVWIALAILLVAIVGMLAVSTRWEWSRPELQGVPAPTLSDTVLLVIGACAQQGFGFNPRTVPSRIVLLMLLLAALSLYASYSANIVALLQSTTDSIRNNKDLADSPIKCGALDVIYNRHYFKIENDPIRRKIIDEKIEPKGGKSNWLSANDGIKAIKRGFFAFYIDTGTAYRLIQETYEEDEKCGFREIYFIDYFEPMFTIVKQSPYVEIFRVNALKIVESGLKDRETLYFFTKRPPCNGLSKFISVGINECYFAFYTMGYGILLSFLVLILELLWIKRFFIWGAN